MEHNPIILKILNVIIFIILSGLGVLYLLAAPVDPSIAAIRIIIGIILIFAAISLLVIISILIQRSKIKVIKISKGDKNDQTRSTNLPNEIICRSCSNAIELTEDLIKKDNVVCEKCGEMIKIPKDNINW